MSSRLTRGSLGWAGLFLAVAPAMAQRPDLTPPDTFPNFVVPGLEQEMRILRELHWLHYHPAFPTATLWDEWLSCSTLWPAVQKDNRARFLRDRWRDALAGRFIDSEGYVATHQHASVAHQHGWPFPFWAQGGDDSWGWHFSMAGTPGPQWVGVPARPPEGWALTNADAESLENDTWNLKLTAPLATVQPPPPIELKVLHAPFLQLRWRARGLDNAQPFIEWQIEGQTEFSADQRVYFEPVETDTVVYTMVPMHRHPKWTGRITALRINFGNLIPGGKVGIQAFFAQYDTRHTVNNQNMIKGVANVFRWTGDINLLRSQIGRARLAMRWLMTDLDGLKEKMIVAKFVGHDGRPGLKRGPDGKAIMLHGHGIGNHYWDLMPCGYRDAYATNLYYDALLALAELEREIAAHPEWNIPGGALRFDPDELERHAQEVKETFQKTFWNPETRRFVLGIDVDGRSYDYGYTFMNLEAIYYGLASPEQARDILDWINGKRIVEGDTSTGADIYHWRFAPRATTRRNLEWYGWYWNAPESIPWGDQVQDGGAVLGFSYHDLMARLAVLGPDDAWERLKTIIAWFDEVQNEGGYRAYYAKPGRGKLQGGGPPGGLGMDKEFVESLLVPQVMLYGFAGFQPTATGFRINPQLPKAFPSLTIDHIALHDLVLKVRVTPDTIEVLKSGPVRRIYEAEVPPGPWTVAYLDASGSPKRTVQLGVDQTSLRLEWSDADGVRLTRAQSAQ